MEVVPLIEWIKRFQEYLTEEDRSVSTIKTYTINLQLFIDWYIQRNEQSFNPDHVTPLDIQDYRAYLDQQLKQDPGTINKKIIVLKTFWSFAVSNGFSTVDPTRKIRLKRTSVQNLAPRWLDRKEQSKFLHSISKETNEYMKKRNLPLVHLMLSAGLRVDEVASLEIADVDLGNRVVKVRAGKGDKYRLVFIQKSLKDSIQEWIDVRVADPDNQFLFPSRVKKLDGITTRSVQILVKKYGEEADIHEVTPHTLRHTFCKNLIDAGNPIEYVAQMAGHESLESTRRYVTPSENDLRRAADSIEQ